jgi:branched-chain amino acid transport system substrate-binding protein
MADYAVRVLGADSAAVITSTGTNYLRMSDAFIERFKKLGGTIIAVEYYRPRDRDFGPQVKDVKRELLGLLPDSATHITPGGDTLEIDAVPAHVDCLYLPGDAEQIKLLLPQINFYNLNSAFLGSDGWADDRIYRLGDELTKTAVFPSPFLEKESSEINLKFSASYDIRYGKRPERLAALGYDAVMMIANAYAAGANGRDKLVRKLSELRQFQGASGKISFGASRENIEMPVYRIDNARPVLVAGQNPTAELLESSR